MIKTENGVTEVTGSTADILVDLSCIISGLYKTFSENYSRVTAAEMIGKAVELGFTCPDEAMTIKKL